MSLAKPKSAIFMTLFSVTKTFLAAKSRWMHWKQKKKNKTAHSNKLQQKWKSFNTTNNSPL